MTSTMGNEPSPRISVKGIVVSNDALTGMPRMRFSNLVKALALWL
jgi:hypothetical protein